MTDIKTEKVFSQSFPEQPLQLSPEIEIQDTTSVTALETEYDDQDYNQQDFDYETADDNQGWIFNIIFIINILTFRCNCCQGRSNQISHLQR